MTWKIYGVNIEAVDTVTQKPSCKPRPFLSLGERIAKLRDRKGYTQKSLARELGISQPTVCAWEQGYRIPSLPVWRALSEAIDLPPEELLEASKSV